VDTTFDFTAKEASLLKRLLYFHFRILQTQLKNASIKGTLLNQVAYLSQRVIASAKDRRRGMIQAAFASINHGAGAVSAVAHAWENEEPLLRACFGI
jgi:hypothetical protein